MDYHRILLIIRGIQWIINGLSQDSLDYQRNSVDYQWIINGLSMDSLDYQRNSVDYQWIIVDSSG